MSRRRKLSADERELWSKVAATTRALRPDTVFSAETEPDTRPDPRHFPPKKPPLDLGNLRVGHAVSEPFYKHDLTPSIGEHLARQPVQMDHKTHKKMSRGRMDPEARIDLHGMTQAQAHPALIRFVQSAFGRGCRLVLVITGKGKLADDGGPIPQRVGVLRHQVPQWLHLPPLGPMVMQVTTAHAKHGGAGAYYVYLRRAR